MGLFSSSPRRSWCGAAPDSGRLALTRGADGARACPPTGAILPIVLHHQRRDPSVRSCTVTLENFFNCRASASLAHYVPPHPSSSRAYALCTPSAAMCARGSRVCARNAPGLALQGLSGNEAAAREGGRKTQRDEDDEVNDDDESRPWTADLQPRCPEIFQSLHNVVQLSATSRPGPPSAGRPRQAALGRRTPGGGRAAAPELPSFKCMGCASMRKALSDVSSCAAAGAPLEFVAFSSIPDCAFRVGGDRQMHDLKLAIKVYKSWKGRRRPSSHHLL